jgi:hypothetical protein
LFYFFVIQVNFTDIIKFETFDRDQDHILKKSGIQDLVQIEKRRTHGQPRKSSDFVQKYIDELSPQLFEEIIELYYVDFEIFGYPYPVQTSKPIVKK